MAAESAAAAVAPVAAASKAAEEHDHGHAHGDGDGHGHSGHGQDHDHAPGHGHKHGHAHGHEHDHSAHGHSHGGGSSCSGDGDSALSPKSLVSPKGADAYAVDAAQADAWCTDAWKGECKGLETAVGRVVTGFVIDSGRGRQALLYFAAGTGSGSGSGSGSGNEKPYRLVPLSSLVPAPAPSTLVQLEQSPLFYAAANGQSSAVSTLLSHHASGNTGFGTTAGKHVVYAAKAVSGGFEVDMHSHPTQPQAAAAGVAASGAAASSASDASGSGKAAPPRPNSRLVSAADIARANGFADAAALLDRHQQCRMCSGGGDCTLM